MSNKTTVFLELEVEGSKCRVKRCNVHMPNIVSNKQTKRKPWPWPVESNYDCPMAPKVVR